MHLDQYEFEEEEDAQSGKFLEFLINNQAYGIPIKFVTEIISIQTVNTLPEAPAHVKGVINLRGRIIPVIDMHCLLNKKVIENTDRTCIMVVESQKLNVGLIVDRVTEVLRIDENDVAPPPEINMKGNRGYLSGVGKVNGKVIMLLDCDKMFIDDESKTILN